MDEEKKIWEMEVDPVLDSDDKRGQFRHDMDKVMGRGMTRYNVKKEGLLELKFPDLDERITERDIKVQVEKGNIYVDVDKGLVRINIKQTATITVGQSITITCPITTINGDVKINGNLTVSGNITAGGNIHAGGDVTAGSVSLRKHHHAGCHGGAPAGG